MENPATHTDLIGRGYDVTNVGVAQTWLDVAWRALRREVPSVEARLTDGTLEDADVIDVIAAAALRVLRNPEGVESESGQIDDYTEAVKHTDATQDVYFTAAELRRLIPLDTAVTGWSGSVPYV